jgi:hypothetical protein
MYMNSSGIGAAFWNEAQKEPPVNLLDALGIQWHE